MRIKDQKRDGSMTIFVSLVMLLVSSVLFTLLEAARFPGLDAKADMNAMLSVEWRLRNIRKRSGISMIFCFWILVTESSLWILRN